MENAEMYQMIVQAITESNDELKTHLLEKIDGVRTDLTSKIDGVRTDLTLKIDGVRTDLTLKIDGVRTEMSAKFEAVNDRFDKLDGDMEFLKSKFYEHERDIFMLKKKIY